MKFEVDDDTTVQDILNKIEKEYGIVYKNKVGKKFINDMNTNYRIFLNNNYLEKSKVAKQQVKKGDQILIFKPISGG
jgi:sulfur carrier protein ThiS